METLCIFTFPKAEESAKDYFVGVIPVGWFCCFVFDINVSSWSKWGMLVYGFFSTSNLIWKRDCQSKVAVHCFQERLVMLCCLPWSQEYESHTWPATLLVTETFGVEFVNSGRLRYTRYESGCDDWRRGTDLSWVMGAECVCFSLVLHVAGWRWAHTRDKPHSEPALHNVSLGRTELILGGE